MRVVTTSDGTSVTVTGLSVLASANSPRMMRPPCLGWPAAGAVVGVGAAGALAAAVGWPAAGALVAAGAVVGWAAGAAVGAAGWDAGPHAASTSRLAVKVDTRRPRTAPVAKSIEGAPLEMCPYS